MITQNSFPPITQQDLSNLYVTTSNNTSGTHHTITMPPNGTAGQVYVASNTGPNWATLSADPNLQGSSLKVMGDANFEGDIKIKGKSLRNSLEKIEEKLAILHPNEELEEKWENLRGLREAYVALEKEIIEKEKMWSILKR
jgi:hypothetical protein